MKLSSSFYVPYLAVVFLLFLLAGCAPAPRPAFVPGGITEEEFDKLVEAEHAKNFIPDATEEAFLHMIQVGLDDETDFTARISEDFSFEKEKNMSEDLVEYQIESIVQERDLEKLKHWKKDIDGTRDYQAEGLKVFSLTTKEKYSPSRPYLGPTDTKHDGTNEQLLLYIQAAPGAEWVLAGYFI